MDDRPAYDRLNAIYDRFQADLDPLAWAEYIHQLHLEQRLPHTNQGEGGRPLLLDLGCGTGRMTAGFVPLGYDIIGVDISPLMLEQAMFNLSEAGITPLLLLQDMCEFELYGTVDLITCLLDTVNHIIDIDRLRKFFAHCATYLHPGGVLIFDLATEFHFAEVLGNAEFFEISDDYALLWQNAYFPETTLSRSEITLFEATEDGLYVREDVTIKERYYSLEQISNLLTEAGFIDLTIHGDVGISGAPELAASLDRAADLRILRSSETAINPKTTAVSENIGGTERVFFVARSGKPIPDSECISE